MRVETLYTCIVCGKGFTSGAALNGHLRVHGDVDWRQFHVRLPAELVERFQAVCKKHKTTTCGLIHSLMVACVVGDEKGDVQIGASNPLTINLVEAFNALPRGHGKYDLSALAVDPLTAVARCPHLDHRDWVSGRLGWCRDVKRWVTLELCAGCVRR